MGQQSYPLGKIVKASIDYLIANKFCFVVFKNPLQNDIHLIVDNPTNSTEHFVLYSFDGKESVDIKGKLYKNEAIQEAIALKNESPLPLPTAYSQQYMNQVQYEQYVKDIIAHIEAGVISKCVAARKKKVMLPQDFNAGEVFNDICIRHAGAFVYMANTPLGLWMGATPELLLYKKENRYFTVALAGTKLVKEKRPWTDKEIDEHKIVVDYIMDTIKNEGFEVHETSPVFDGGSGHLLHLKMDINFYADRSIHQALHPTPAVCGIPLNAAKEIILNHESKTRSLYSGYLGLHGENARYYVNLRCMQIFDDYANVYVGAGITAESNPTDEWFETEAKSEVMIRMIGKIRNN